MQCLLIFDNNLLIILSYIRTSTVGSCIILPLCIYYECIFFTNACITVYAYIFTSHSDPTTPHIIMDLFLGAEAGKGP